MRTITAAQLQTPKGRAPSNGPAARPPNVSRETLQASRQAVHDLLQRSDAFNKLDESKRKELAHGLVQIASQLAEPGGQRLKPSQMDPRVRALAESGIEEQDAPKLGEGAMAGVKAAGALLETVDFPNFCSGLINGVFHAIVQSSIEQMEAYAKLVADVSKSLNQFRDENTTANQGRDQLVDQFPDLFQLSMDTGDFAFGDEEGQQSSGPRVIIKEGIDEKAAIERINASLPLDKPITRLDDELVEALLVPAAQTQIATSRQQLLATMVMLGINRIVVTDGKLSAKVIYDFQARDNLKYRASAQKFDYGDQYVTTGEGTYESDYQGGDRSYSRGADGAYDSTSRDASYYSKGTYKTTAQPVLKLAKATTTSIDASLSTKAQLAGTMEVNFKNDYVPLDKLANPESIAAIQMNAQPGMVKNLAARPAAKSTTPASPGTTTP